MGTGEYSCDETTEVANSIAASPSIHRRHARLVVLQYWVVEWTGEVEEVYILIHIV